MPATAQPRSSRQEQARQAVRQRIMDEGRKLFAEKGYEAATMRDLARATQYTPSALYYHFKDKAELMHAICSEDFAGLATRFQGCLTNANALANIQNLGRAFAQFALEHPNHYRLMFMNQHLPPASAEDLARMGDPGQDAYAVLLQLVNQAMAQDLLRPGLTDPHLVAQTLWAGIHGVISLQLEKGCEEWFPWADIQARVDLMCDVLNQGLGKS